MSEYGFCPRGDQQGIRTSKEELIRFAHQLSNQFIDERIPLPNGIVNKLCNRHDSEIYYEMVDTGAHGWCCAKCGQVTQWG